LNSNKPVVLVADTGLDLSDPTVNRNLWTDQRVVRGIEKRYGKNSHGTNLTASIKGSIDISPTYQFAYHGTEVVKIIVGGSSAPSTLLAQFEIAIGKVIPDREPFNIGADAIGSTFMYAQYIPNTKVLNLSVVIASEEQKLIAGMQAAGNMLVVSAAGNNNRWLEDTHLYPPCLTSYPDRLIVVGAHDWENRKADFSNYGESVDLLAPGCGIPIRGRDGEILLHSGTSYAAPFVSFTAALLSTYGMSPGEIKGRILLTVDFDKTLRGVARSAGRLNIENALSYRDDILVVKAKGKDDSGKNIEKILTLYGDFNPHLAKFGSARTKTYRIGFLPLILSAALLHSEEIRLWFGIRRKVH